MFTITICIFNYYPLIRISTIVEDCTTMDSGCYAPSPWVDSARLQNTLRVLKRGSFQASSVTFHHLSETDFSPVPRSKFEKSGLRGTAPWNSGQDAANRFTIYFPSFAPNKEQVCSGLKNCLNRLHYSNTTTYYLWQLKRKNSGFVSVSPNNHGQIKRPSGDLELISKWTVTF